VRVASLGAIIAVTGLAFEARIAARSGVAVMFNSDRVRLIDALEQAIQRGARGIISFGIAGGLAPHLRLGDCVVPSAIMTEKRRFQTDAEWSAGLLAGLKRAHDGAIIGVDAAVADPRTKRGLHERTGAVAVDMESHVVAEIAEAYGVPFTALRVVADPAHRVLPPAALMPLRNNGKPDLRSIFESVARGPRQMPALVKLARDAYVARRALLRSREMLGPRLGFPD
jgi:adenosylhomocysteine nucleosidase